MGQWCSRDTATAAAEHAVAQLQSHVESQPRQTPIPHATACRGPRPEIGPSAGSCFGPMLPFPLFCKQLKLQNKPDGLGQAEPEQLRARIGHSASERWAASCARHAPDTCDKGVTQTESHPRWGGGAGWAVGTAVFSEPEPRANVSRAVEKDRAPCT